MSSRGFDDVQDAVSRMHSLVSVAKGLDDVEMQLVLNSDILGAMTCTYRAAASALTRHRDALWWQLDSELARVVSSLAVLQRSREVPDRLALAQHQWQSASDNVGDLGRQIGRLEEGDTGWSGRARSGKSLAVERQRVATDEFAAVLHGLGGITRDGRLLMEAVFSAAALDVQGSNAQLGGFVHRAPTAAVGLWGLFSRSIGAVGRVRATAGFLERHLSAGAPWRVTASQLRSRVDGLAAGGQELTSAGWPRAVARP